MGFNGLAKTKPKKVVVGNSKAMVSYWYYMIRKPTRKIHFSPKVFFMDSKKPI
jgi:hypothetical protein